MTPITDDGQIVTQLVLKVFQLNGQFLSVAEKIAAPAGLTAARWQVLGAVLREPKTVSNIAHDMGLARQSVQRLANILIDEGQAEYRDNPSHKRAKLLAITARGQASIERLGNDQHAWANALAATVDPADLESCLCVLSCLSDHLDSN